MCINSSQYRSRCLLAYKSFSKKAVLAQTAIDKLVMLLAREYDCADYGSSLY